MFLLWSSLTAIDPSYLMASDADEDMFSMIGPALGYVGLMAIVAIGFVAWIFIISIKAVKTVNGFSTAKALGLIILVMIISSIIIPPLGM